MFGSALSCSAGESCFSLWMASNTSLRWTGTSRGASTPRRTLSPRISTTTIVMSSLIMILSFFLRDSTNKGFLLYVLGRRKIDSW